MFLRREVETLIQQTLPKSIQIRAHITTNLWPVLGDATQLHQVFMNLCVNARDAMADGGALTISAENRALDSAAAKQYLEAIAGASYVMVTVQDTGSGMSGLESKDMIEKSKRLGFQDFLAKPFTTQDLLLVIQCPR